MSSRYNKEQKIIFQEISERDNLTSQKIYTYICNCRKCNGSEVNHKTQVKHANKKELWNSEKSRKKQLEEIEIRKSRYVAIRNAEKIKKKRKRSSQQSSKNKIPKLRKDTSVSDMLTELSLAPNISDENEENEELVIASSSRTRNDHFHEPLQDEMPDIIEEESLYNIENEEINLIDASETDKTDEIDDEADEEIETDDNYDNENLFAALEFEDDKYENMEIEDKLDVEILL